jgi:hypothetical protein
MPLVIKHHPVHRLGQLTPGLIKGPSTGVVLPEHRLPEGGGGGGYVPPTDDCVESILRKPDCSLKPMPIVGGMVALGIVAGLLLRRG